SLNTYTVKEDSVPTRGLSSYLLGASNSSTFGNQQADISFSFTLPAVSNFSFPAGSIIDSVVLVLQNVYDGYNGNLSSLQHIEVYELDQYLNPDSLYYSTFKPLTKAVPDATWQGNFAPNDSFVHSYNGITANRNPQLRIRLN